MGIKTGSAFVGNFGTAERMNYSAIGDAVNTAARLQALNKTYGTHIIIEEETLRATGTQFLVRPLGVVEVRGKKEKLKIYELVAQKKGEPEILPTPEKIELCTLFTQAYDLFEKGNLKEAQKVFETLHKKFPNDLPTKLYLDTF
jgi:adenylate cyclase